MDLSPLLAFVPSQDMLFVLAVFGLAAALDAWLPQPGAGSHWVLPRKLLSVLGQNYRNAANSTPAGRVAHVVEAAEQAAVDGAG